VLVLGVQVEWGATRIVQASMLVLGVLVVWCASCTSIWYCASASYVGIL
jgi:hypothetical protein